VRVRDHLALSTVGAMLLYPRLRGAVLGPWAASILIDVDHYLWFCLRQRRLNPLAALRFFNHAQPPQHRQTRLLHSPAVLLGLLLLTRRRPAAWALLGMAFHVALDAYDMARRRQARAAALARDGWTCQHCGTQGPEVVAHLWHQPCLLPSYRPAHLTSLCGACHEAAHGALRAPAGPGLRSGPAAPSAHVAARRLGGATARPSRGRRLHAGATRRLCSSVAPPIPVVIGARCHG
jgi:hypothetical protein